MTILASAANAGLTGGLVLHILAGDCCFLNINHGVSIERTDTDPIPVEQHLYPSLEDSSSFDIR